MAAKPAAGPLKLVSRVSKPRKAEKPFYVGRRYSVAEGLAMDQARRACADQDLVVGGYRLAPERAEILAVDLQRSPGQLFVWNSDASTVALQDLLATASDESESSLPAVIAANRLQLIGAGLIGPELQYGGATPCLKLLAEFELDWHTDSCTAELGCVELVESVRSVHFEDDSCLTLIDTEKSGGPVRYDHGDGYGRPVTPIGGRQVKGEHGRHLYRLELAQAIPDMIDGRAVAEVTVLEKYTSYFMQCEDPGDPERFIWTPLLSPVMWGWSMRVGRCTDGEWGILRRKLFMPTCHDEGLSLPLWQSDIHSNTRRV